MRLLKPKVVNVVNKLTGRNKPRSLLDYRENSFTDMRGHASSFSESVNKVFSDHEIKLLVIWAIISPTAALAYLIWVKYPELKWVAVPLLVISVFQFIGQWGGLYWLLQRLGLLA